jgi:hypothetical protein
VKDFILIALACFCAYGYLDPDGAAHVIGEAVRYLQSFA